MEYSIGDLAARAGYAVRTLRYFEHIGLCEANGVGYILGLAGNGAILLAKQRIVTDSANRPG